MRIPHPYIGQWLKFVLELHFICFHDWNDTFLMHIFASLKNNCHIYTHHSYPNASSDLDAWMVAHMHQMDRPSYSIHISHPMKAHKNIFVARICIDKCIITFSSHFSPLLFYYCIRTALCGWNIWENFRVSDVSRLFRTSKHTHTHTKVI